MGSVVNFVDCPHCHGEETVQEEYRYRSGEWWTVCSRCGESKNHLMIRDDDGNVEHENVLYPIKDCRIAVWSVAESISDMDTHISEELWSMPLSEIGEVSEDRLADWINEKWNPEGVTLPHGRHNVFCGDEQLFYIGNWFDVDGDNLVVQKAKWDDSYYSGAGLIAPTYEEEGRRVTSLIYLKEGDSKEEALKLLEEIRADKTVIQVETATWWNPETQELENLLA